MVGSTLLLQSPLSGKPVDPGGRIRSPSHFTASLYHKWFYFPKFFWRFGGDGQAQKTRRRWGLRRVIECVRLFGNDVGGLRTFFSLGLFELDLLALFQRFESFGLDFREVYKNVLPFLRFDKTVPLAFVEPLDFTYRHTNRAPQIEREGVPDGTQSAFPSCLSGDSGPIPEDPARAPLFGLP